MPAKAQVVLHDINALPKDAVCNTFYFRTAGAVPTVAEQDEIADALRDFYKVAHNSVNAIGEYLGPTISRSAVHDIKIYDNEGGSPLSTHDLTALPAPLDAFGVPRQVAAVLSFHANLTGVAEQIPQPPAGPEGDLRPRSRLRGRVYIGPLNRAAIANSERGHLIAGFISALLAGAEFLRDPAFAGPLPAWAVYSQVADVYNDVVGGWVDDRPDTQRRRLRGPEARNLF